MSIVRAKSAGEFGFADLNGMEVSLCKGSLGEQRVRVTCPHLVRVGGIEDPEGVVSGCPFGPAWVGRGYLWGVPQCY